MFTANRCCGSIYQGYYSALAVLDLDEEELEVVGISSGVQGAKVGLQGDRRLGEKDHVLGLVDGEDVASSFECPVLSGGHLLRGDHHC